MTGLLHLALALQLVLATANSGKTDSREEIARAFFATGQYQSAIEVYSQLYAQYVDPIHIYNIGRCYQNMGDADMALKSFKEFTRKMKKMDPSARRELDGHIKEMEELKAQRAALTRKLETDEAEAPSPAKDTNAEPAADAATGKEKPTASPAGANKGKDSTGLVDAYLASLRSDPEEAWTSRALQVDEDKLAKTVAMVNGANQKDPRLAEYQFHLATQYAGKHFTLRLQEIRSDKEKGTDSRKVASGERKLGPQISATFTKAAEYYLAVSKQKEFAKFDQALLGLAVLLQANNMESRAKNVLLQILRNLPRSKAADTIRGTGAE
jgi:tetratricopeptide (TPR) repeat protein